MDLADITGPTSVDKDDLAYILRTFIESPPQDNIRYAWGKKLANEELLESFVVEGLGKVSIPISEQDARRLRECADVYTNHMVLNTVIREGWQFAADRVQSPEPANFFNSKLNRLATNAFLCLGVDTEALGINLHLDKLLLYNPEGPYQRNRCLPPPKGTFAKLILHIPVEGASDGGRLRVERHGDVKYFYYDADSDRQFYCTIFYADCEHELQDMDIGWRALMVFNVTWEQTEVFLPPLPYLPAFMAALKDIQRVLSTWHCHQLQYQPRLLAIPLCHFYQRHISFADLKNKDRLIAALFKSIDTIDVFLVAPLADNRTTPPKPPSSYNRHDAESDTTLSLWVDATDQPVDFGALAINYPTELVGNMDEDNLHELTALLDNETHFLDNNDLAMERQDRMVEQLLEQPVIVIWPKKQSVTMACQRDLDTYLNQVEDQVRLETVERTGLVVVLQQILVFCCHRPIRVWFRQDETHNQCSRTRRLMDLCLLLQAEDQGLELLRLLGCEFRARVVRTDVEKATDDIWFYEGIRNDEVAASVAAFIVMVGWNRCDQLIHRLVSNRVDQIGSFCCLSAHLLGLDCVLAAVEVARATFGLLASDDTGVDADAAVYCACAELLVRLESRVETCDVDRVTGFVVLAQKLDAYRLGRLVIHVQRSIGDLVTSTRDFYLKLCRLLVLRPFDDTLLDIAEELTIVFMELGDAQILQDFVNSVATARAPTSAGHNVLLQKILESARLDRLFMTNSWGQQVLRFLMDTRIDELSDRRQPTFSWVQPDAVLPPDAVLHPDAARVLHFLHSPQRSLLLQGSFQSLDEAADFAERYFGPHSPQQGFSAGATVGLQPNAYCQLWKTTHLFEDAVRSHRALRAELQRWISVRFLRWGHDHRTRPLPELTSDGEHVDSEPVVDAGPVRRVRYRSQSPSSVRHRYHQLPI